MAATKRWSGKVTRESNALDLEANVFTNRSARAIALSLRRSAERSTRRKASPFRSAMSMLTFYENRAGKNLPATRKAVLDQAKDELRALYGRERQNAEPGRRPARKARGRKKSGSR